jgi:hydrogenase-4 component E
MTIFTPHFLFFVEAVVFASVVMMHLTKKSSSAVYLYILQSIAVSFLLFSASIEEVTTLIIPAIIAMFVVKVIIAPQFFFNLIKKHRLTFSASTYLNTPVTLFVLAALTVFSFGKEFLPLASLALSNERVLPLAFATVLISVFLIINRKGALSQMLGVLSLENGIVSFAALAGLSQSPALELGIIFDIFIWIMIATVFVSMIYQKFGSLDVTTMTHLREE